MKAEPLMPTRWFVVTVALGVFAMTPALWPVHGLGALFASLVLRLGVTIVLLCFIVRFSRRNGVRGPHLR